jgi:hypothetical protein
MQWHGQDINVRGSLGSATARRRGRIMDIFNAVTLKN